MHAEHSKGLLCALSAYTLWGLFPIYFKHMGAVPATQLIAHRVVWGCVFVMLLLLVLRRWAWLAEVWRAPRVLGLFAATSALLVVNSLLYVWAMQQGQVLEASLGYFINPLINVVLGFVFLHERLRRAQYAALALAAAGVAWFTWVAGSLPWVALLIALTFGFYGLLRKLASLGTLEGLALESMLAFPLMLGALAWWNAGGESAFANSETSVRAWLVFLGPMTAVPLLLFAAAARRIPMATLGLVQYVSPSIQFLLGLWLFHEPFSPARAVGFGLIWAALAVYSVEGWWRGRGAAAKAASAA